MRQFLVVISILLSLISPANAAGWSAELTIDSMFVYGHNDQIVINTSGGAVYTAGCIADRWFLTSNTPERYARLYSTLLSAMHTGKKVKLWYVDSCTTWNYHEAQIVAAYK